MVSGRGRAYAAVVVAVVVLLTAGCSGDEVATTASGGEAAATANTSARREIVVAETGFASYDTFDHTHSSWAVVIDNPTLDVAVDVTLELTFKDAEGIVIDVKTEHIRAIQPGRSAWAREQPARTLGPGVWDGPVASLDTRVSVGGWQPRYDQGSLTATDVRFVAGKPTDIAKVTGTVRSTHNDEQHDVAVVALVRDGNGKLLGGARRRVDVVPPGQSTIEVEEWEPLPGASSAELYLLPGTMLSTDITPCDPRECGSSTAAPNTTG